MKKPLFYFALAGWVLSLLIHILSLLDVNVSAKFPYIWGLHLGVFVVWIPAILVLRKKQGLSAFQQKSFPKSISPFAQLKFFLKDAPDWLKVIAVAGFVYALVNFLLFRFSQHYTPEMKDDQYILQNRGQFVRTITKEEYDHYRASIVRGFSGHWIALYGLAMAILYPFSKKAHGHNQPS